MAAQINDKCTSCAACEPMCPTYSISVGNPRYVIDSDTCENCCLCVPVCPVEAIVVVKPKPVKAAKPQNPA